MERPVQESDPTLLHRFLRIARGSPGQVMMEEWGMDDGKTSLTCGISYREAFDLVCRHAVRLKSDIPGDESLVALSAPPGTGFVLSDLALLMAGKTVVLIDHLQPESAVRDVLDTFGVRTLVTADPQSHEALRSGGVLLLPLAGNVRHQGREGEGSCGTDCLPLESPDWDRILDGLFRDGASAVAHLLLTSGTTGRPKGVPLTHENLLFDCDRILEMDVYEHEDRVLCVLPLHHSYPFMVNILLPLSVGATILFPPDLSPAALRGILSSGQVTLFPAVPALWEGFHRRIQEEIGKRPPLVAKFVRKVLIPFSFYLRQHWKINAGALVFSSVRRRFGSSMKALASGGAALRPEIARDFFAMGLTILEGYGLTETSPVSCMNRMGDFRVGSVGKPLPGVEVRVDPPEEDRPGGRVFIRGKHVASSYWESCSKRRPLTDSHGWFETGDLGLWQDGFLVLVGREKEVIVLSNGKNIFAEPLERMVGEKDGIEEAGVLLEKNALVVLVRPIPSVLDKKDRSFLEKMISEAVSKVNAALPPHSRIASFEWTPEPLPRTRLGKLRRFMLPGIFQEAKNTRLLTASGPVSGRLEGPLGSRIREILREVSGETGPVEEGMNLESDLGIDSLGRIELLQRVEEALGQPVPDELLSDLQTVGDLLTKIALLAPEIGGVLSETLWTRPLDPAEVALLPERGREERLSLSFREKLIYRTLRGAGRIFFGIRWPKCRMHRTGEVEEWVLLLPGGKERRLPPVPFVIVANHASYLDGLLLALCLPPVLLSKTLFWGYAPLFDGPLKPLRNLFGIVSIDSTQALSGLRIALHLLRSGRSLGIFPEGERSLDGTLKGFKPGVGLILSKVCVSVVPVALLGVYQVYPSHRTLPRPGPVDVKIGEFIDPKKFAGLSDQGIADLLEREVRTLLEESGERSRGPRA